MTELESCVCSIKAVLRSLEKLADTEAFRLGGGKPVLPEDVLKKYGFRRGNCGFNFLCKAVELYEEQNGKTRTCCIYQKVAREYDTTPQRVERGIRTCVETTFDRSRQLQQQLGCSDKPTNSEMIATLYYDWLSMSRK